MIESGPIFGIVVVDVFYPDAESQRRQKPSMLPSDLPSKTHPKEGCWMSFGDVEVWRRRERQERAAAKQAWDVRARRAHQELAMQFSLLIFDAAVRTDSSERTGTA